MVMSLLVGIVMLIIMPITGGYLIMMEQMPIMEILLFSHMSQSIIT